MIQLEAEYLTNTYQTAMQGIEQAIFEKILEEEVKAGGYDSQALLKAEVEDKVGEASTEEIAQMYEQFKSRLEGMTLEMATPLITQQLMRQNKANVSKLTWKSCVPSTMFKSPYHTQKVPRQKVSADDDPFLGTDGAPVEIIQFAEFQCPYCGKVGPMIDKLLETYPGKLKIVYRDFPLNFHDRAIPAAWKLQTVQALKTSTGICTKS